MNIGKKVTWQWTHNQIHVYNIPPCVTTGGSNSSKYMHPTKPCKEYLPILDVH